MMTRRRELRLQVAILAELERAPARGFDLWAQVVGQGIVGHDHHDRRRIMRELQNNGLVMAKWVVSETGPRVRCYEITEAGRRYRMRQEVHC